MDQQLTSLLGSFWSTGDPDAARVLADRLQELPAEDVAEALVRFRTVLQVLPALVEAGRLAVGGARDVFRAITEALRALPPEEVTRLVQAVPPEGEECNFPP